MHKLLIDCDPGQDDAIAIMMAFAHPEMFEIKAITTVCGNNTLEKVTHNARVIQAVLGTRVPVAPGMNHPLVGRPVISAEFHGESGMDGPTSLPDVTCVPLARLHAVECMRQTLDEAEEPITLAALGPLTNIAVLIRMYPRLLPKLRCISLMGGSLGKGNSSPWAEFNIFVDPEAAQIVFSSGVPVVMSGLDLTTQVLLHPQQTEPLRSRGAIGRFFCELLDFYGKSSLRFGAAGSQMHDPMAVAWLLQPDLFTGRRGHVDVVLAGEERGRTTLRENAAGNTLVLTGADIPAAAQLVLSSVEKLCTP